MKTVHLRMLKTLEDVYVYAITDEIDADGHKIEDMISNLINLFGE